MKLGQREVSLGPSGNCRAVVDLLTLSTEPKPL
jgi:hypothetical protein